MSWLNALMKATKDHESPREYYYWAGLTALAAVARNKVWLPRYFSNIEPQKLYPNIYVILIGKSGIRKGPPVALVKDLVMEVNCTRVISGRGSIQAILKELGTAFTRNDGGPPVKDACGLLSSSEFSSFIVRDDAALTILTDIYDSSYYDRNAYKNITKGQGVDNLERPCVSLIGASNEVHFRDVIPDNAVGGGFIARTFLIVADKKSGINAGTKRLNETDYIPIPKIAEYLKVISQVEGPFSWEEEAREFYDRWYDDFNKRNYHDPTGTLERIHDSILKVAMLLSLSRSTELILNKTDIDEAIQNCLAFVAGARKVTMGQGKATTAAATAMILKDMLARPMYRATKKQLLQKYWAHFDSYDLERIIDSLQNAGAIDISLGEGSYKDRDIWYTLTPTIVEKYQKLQEES